MTRVEEAKETIKRLQAELAEAWKELGQALTEEAREEKNEHSTSRCESGAEHGNRQPASENS